MENLISHTFELVSWSAFLLGGLTILLGAVTQGTTGIGFGLIAAPILMLINPIFVPGTILFLAFFVSILVARRERHSIDRKGLTLAVIGRIIGAVTAGLTMAVIPTAMFGFIFGVLVLCAVLLSASGWKFMPSSRNLLTAGIASGYMGTITSIGTPPIALVYQHQKGPIVRSTIAVYLVIGTVVSLVTVTAVGKFTLEQMLLSVLFLPLSLAGFRISSWIIPRVKGKAVRYMILILSSMSALVLIIKSLIMMM